MVHSKYVANNEGSGKRNILRVIAPKTRNDQASDADMGMGFRIWLSVNF
jgi:hypothetical protein